MGTKDKRAALEQQLKTQSERISQRFQKAQAQVEPKKMTVQGVVKQYPWAIALGAATIGALIGVVVVMRNKTGDDVKTIGRGAKIRVPRSIADQVRVTHDQSELQRAVQSGEKVLIYDATPKASADWGRRVSSTILRSRSRAKRARALASSSADVGRFFDAGRGGRVRRLRARRLRRAPGPTSAGATGRRPPTATRLRCGACCRPR